MTAGILPGSLRSLFCDLAVFGAAGVTVSSLCFGLNGLNESKGHAVVLMHMV